MVPPSTTWSIADRASESLEVHLLGMVDFESAQFLQERLVYEISGRQDILGGLLLCEHPPLVTIGREGSRSHLRCTPEELAARQLEVKWLNRGGGCVVHGPGQLAVYPVVPLNRLGIGLADYCLRLQQAVSDTCTELRVPTFQKPDEAGVWCRTGRLATVGVAVKSWVAYHGLFLDVCPSLDLMRLVTPPEDDSRLTSMAAQRLRMTSMHAVRSRMIQNIVQQLGYTQHHVYTNHPLLKRTRKRIYDYA